MNKKNSLKRWIVPAIIVVLLIICTVVFFPIFKELINDEKRNQLINFIRGKGIWGILILLGLQVIQVVIAIIPGEVIEIISGVLYGTFGGFLICIIGVLLSSIFVFYIVKKLGIKYVEKIVTIEKINKFRFLNDTTKLNSLIFILFFIPGTPKDLLTYVVPLTNIKPLNFFIISSFARIPSIISSTYAGATISEGNFKITIIIFVITGIVGLIGIYINDKIMKKLNKAHSKDKNL